MRVQHSLVRLHGCAFVDLSVEPFWATLILHTFYLCRCTRFDTDLEDVAVPVENRIGEEGAGFKIILENFNHERFAIAAHALRSARLCIQESVRYARQRKTFGKRLIDHQVIRFKIAEMAMRVESTFAYEEQIAYQMAQKTPNSQMGGPVALLKVMASRTFEFCAREASQIFGGSSYVREGQGAVIERLYREVRGTAIYGGSEEIMLDLAMKQARL